jgi:hypothetical protein
MEKKSEASEEVYGNKSTGLTSGACDQQIIANLLITLQSPQTTTLQ